MFAPKLNPTGQSTSMTMDGLNDSGLVVGYGGVSESIFGAKYAANSISEPVYWQSSSSNAYDLIKTPAKMSTYPNSDVPNCLPGGGGGYAVDNANEIVGELGDCLPRFGGAFLASAPGTTAVFVNNYARPLALNRGFELSVVVDRGTPGEISQGFVPPPPTLNGVVDFVTNRATQVLTPVTIGFGANAAYSGALGADGTVVGAVIQAPYGFVAAAQLTSGKVVMLQPKLTFKNTYANAISATGVFVGHAGGLHQAAVMWPSISSPGVDLNSLLPGSSSWDLTEATAVNANGGIVGLGTLNGTEHDFLLSRGTAKTLSVDVKVTNTQGQPVSTPPQTGTSIVAKVTIKNAASASGTVTNIVAEPIAVSPRTALTPTGGPTTSVAGISLLPGGSESRTPDVRRHRRRSPRSARRLVGIVDAGSFEYWRDDATL